MRRGNKIKNNKAEFPVPTNLKELHALESVIQSRLNYASALGSSYGGNRNLYQALGYKPTLSYENYLQFYKREDIAKTLIEKLPKACWSNRPTVTDKEENSSFEREYEALAKKFRLYSIMFRADKLMGLGRYAVLFLGFNDNESEKLSDPVTPRQGLELLYIQPYSDQNAKILTLDNDTRSPRFGLPEIYQISTTHTYNSIVGGATKKEMTVQVHHSRVIHLLEDPLENMVEGTPRLEALYNRIEDTRKILGGSAEMFWRGGVPGKVATTREDYKLNPPDKEALKEQFDEYENNLRRWLTVQGVDIKNLETAIESPKEFLEVQLNIISIVTGIPKRILIGSERGKLSSSQDQIAWNYIIGERHTQLCAPVFIRPLVDRLIEFGIMPEPADDSYMIEWPELISIGELEKSEINRNRITALKDYLNSLGGDYILPSDIFLRKIFGMTQEELDEVKQLRESTTMEDDFVMDDTSEEPNTPVDENA